MEEQQVVKKTLYSGIQPTGCITIGNYVGAINNWLKLQEDYNCIFSIVDLHSLTVRQVPAELRQRAISFYAQYIALGLNPDKSILYMQSQVPEHTQLTWILNCFSYIGELERMTQFKEKSLKNQDNLNMGLMDYPVLMAADILLYNTALVPVGIDQKQHLEFARDIALRFNNLYGEVFTIPEPYIPESGAKIFSLQNPTEKMSKSDSNENATISIVDEPEVIMRKMKRAVTDSDNTIKMSPEKPGVSNLLTIYTVFADTTIDEALKHFENKGYGDFKTKVGESVVEVLKPIQARYYDLIKNKDYLEEIYRDGANKALAISSRTLNKVYKKIGFIPKSQI
jgi:tryptophanyl-tRNA synthetase